MKIIDRKALLAALIMACGNGVCAMHDPLPLLTSIPAGYVVRSLSFNIPEEVTSSPDMEALAKELLEVIKDPRFSGIEGKVPGSPAAIRATAGILSHIEDWREEREFPQTIISHTAGIDLAPLQGRLENLPLASLKFIEELMMSRSDKSRVIDSLMDVPEGRFNDFVAVVQSLTIDMNGFDKSRVIASLAKVPEDRFNDFLVTVERLNIGMSEYGKTLVIQALARVPEERFNDFVAAVERLMVGRSAHDKSRVIQALGRVPEGNLTPVFVRAVERLAIGMYESQKFHLIEVLGRVPEERFNDFVAAAERLALGMSEYGKSSVIEILGEVLKYRFTPEFVAAAERLTSEMNEYEKSCLIEILGSFPGKHLTPEVVNTAMSAAEGKTGDDRFTAITGFLRAHFCRWNNEWEGVQTIITNTSPKFMPLQSALEKLPFVSLQIIDRLMTSLECDNFLLMGVLESVSVDRLTPTFVAAIEKLTIGLDAFDRCQVMHSLMDVPEGRLSPEFVVAAERLTPLMDCITKDFVIKALGKVPEEYLTSAFVDAAMSAADEVHADDRWPAIYAAVAFMDAAMSTASAAAPAGVGGPSGASGAASGTVGE